MTQTASPVLIGGASRSGKTYMRFMLDSLPNLAISRRTQLWPYFYNRFGDLSDDENLDRCLLALDKKKHVRLLLPDMKEIRQNFRKGPPTYPQLFSRLHEEYARKLGKSRWGDQTEGLERYGELIFSSYGGAKFIHLIRDPRDRFEAILARNPSARNRLGIETGRWIESWDLAQTLRDKYPDRYKIVHYEEMVRDPTTVMMSVCEFIGEEYDNEMVTLNTVARFRDLGKKNGHITPLSPDYIGRYQTGLTAFQIRFIQSATRERLAQAGYQEADPELVSSAHLGVVLFHGTFHRLQLQAAKAYDRFRILRSLNQPIYRGSG